MRTLRSRGFERVRAAFCVLLAFILVCVGSTQSVAALTDKQINLYSQNSIFLYDPEAVLCDDEEDPDDPLGDGSDGKLISGNLEEAIKKYGEFAMEMQRKYGVPWEVVFAQMALESGVGTAGIAIHGATNNWLGISGKGDTGQSYMVWDEKNNKWRHWAIYSSVEACIEAWAGKKVLRNGRYDAAFKYLNPDNYNIHGFLVTMINVYAPKEDGNDTEAYVANIEKYLNGSVKKAREEMGWPSSAELAANENIPIGGEESIGSYSGDDMPMTISPNVCLDDTERGRQINILDLLKSGGYTLQEAIKLISAYMEAAKRGEQGIVMVDGVSVGANNITPPDGTLNNCAAFVEWFLKRYTTATGINLWGPETIESKLNGVPGFKTGSTTPELYSVMVQTPSDQKDIKHVAIVLGIDTDRNKIILGEASYHNGYVEGKWPGVHEYDLDKYTDGNHRYIHIDDSILRKEQLK